MHKFAEAKNPKKSPEKFIPCDTRKKEKQLFLFKSKLCNCEHYTTSLCLYKILFVHLLERVLALAKLNNSLFTNSFFYCIGVELQTCFSANFIKCYAICREPKEGRAFCERIFCLSSSNEAFEMCISKFALIHSFQQSLKSLPFK